MVKVDCHVHSKYSKHVAITSGLIKVIGAKECYNELEGIYNTAKDRGMDFVAITDHDTIEGALILNEKKKHKKLDDVIIGEEFEVKGSSEGHFVHIVALGIDKKIHEDITDLKKIGLRETTRYLKDKDIFYFIAHLTHSASEELLSPKLIREWVGYANTLEVLNGTATPQENRLTRIIVELYGKNIVAGSDAHTLAAVGNTFTVSEKAKTKEEFLEALKRGEVYVKGQLDCNTMWLTKEAFKFTYNAFKEGIFHPGQKQRSAFKKYFSDYLVMAGMTPLILTGLTVYLASKGYQRKHIKRALKLQEEILEDFLEDPGQSATQKWFYSKLRNKKKF